MNTKIAAASMITAFAVGMVITGPHDGQAKAGSPTVTREDKCVGMNDALGGHAGDLCDTLNVASAREWASYNLANGWKLVYVDDSGNGCWDTRSTTDSPYTLCWDGTLLPAGR